MRQGEAMKDIIHAFRDEGYHVGTPLKLNAMWFGVPQKRKHVFIIGSLDPTINFAQPTPLFDDKDTSLPENESRKKTFIFLLLDFLLIVIKAGFCSHG